MTTEGYSENDRQLDIEIGHVAGLRWFTLSGSSGCGGGTVTVTTSAAAPLRAECSCGSWFQAARGDGEDTRLWMQRHHAGTRFGRRAEPPVLRGAYAEWEPGENVARCIGGTPDGHTSPPRAGHRTLCHCGFWAYWALGAKVVSGPHAVGLVHGYGHVIDGDLGFRASHVALQALFLPSPDLELQLAVEDRYQVPVFNSLGAMLAMHPAPEGQPALSDGGWTVADGQMHDPAGGQDYWSYLSGGSYGYVTWGGGGGGGGYYASAGGGGGGGWSRQAETASQYASRIGLAGHGCPGCGAPGGVSGGHCLDCTTAALSAAALSAAAAVRDCTAKVKTPIDALADLDKRKAAWEAANPGTPSVKGLNASAAIIDEVAPGVIDAITEAAAPVSWKARVKPYAGSPYGFTGAGADKDGNFSPMSMARGPLSATFTVKGALTAAGQKLLGGGPQGPAVPGPAEAGEDLPGVRGVRAARMHRGEAR